MLTYRDRLIFGWRRKAVIDFRDTPLSAVTAENLIRVEAPANEHLRPKAQSMMKRIISVASVLLATAAIAVPAEACRVFLSPEKRIQRAYARSAELGVALVRITEARHFALPFSEELRRQVPGYEDPWRATASVRQLLAGEQSPELVIFDRGWGFSACDDGTKMPDKGDDWIVYFVSGSRGEAEVLETYPLQIAMQADPRIRRIKR